MQLRTPIAVGAFAAHSRRDATAPLAVGGGGEVRGRTTARPIAAPFRGDIQSTLSEQIFDVAITEGEPNIEPNRVSDDRRGNWWRANEIVMRHLTRRLETRYRCRDKAR